MVSWFNVIVLVPAGLFFLVIWPSRGPITVIPSLLLGLGFAVKAWCAAEGTALRSAVAWAMVAFAIGLIGEATAGFEPVARGRPVTGHLVYVGTLAILAGLIAVLNARTPGAGAWAILTALLVLVFLIPWLEGAGLGRAPGGLARLRLEAPWSIFYGLIVVAGVTNYLPTRYGIAAALLGIGFAVEYVALIPGWLAPATRALLWPVVPWTLAAAAAVAGLASSSAPSAGDRLERQWVWFCDHWGVVWGLRVRERFNRTANAQKWPVRLGWRRLDPPEDVDPRAWSVRTEPFPPEVEAMLKGLLRRFVTASRIDRAIGPE
jgi:hypothetical protein